MARASVTGGAGRTRARGRASGASGAVLIEFALSLPLLFLLITGIFDFGFLFQKYQVLTNAAREGARMAVLPGYNLPDHLEDVRDRVDAYLTAGGAKGASTANVVINVVNDTVTTSSGTQLAAKSVTVSLDHTFTFMVPFAAFYGGTFGTITLTARSVMRTEVAAGGD